MCSILFVPAGIIQAITNQHTSLYLVAQLICGAVFPGRPVANMVFVTYSYVRSLMFRLPHFAHVKKIVSSQGLKFSADLKLGQTYMKIPPKLLFKVQIASTLVSSLTQVGVLNWMLVNIPNMCNTDAIDGFTWYIFQSKSTFCSEY
jgi:hypothetical protein